MANYFHTALDKKSRTIIIHEAIKQLAKVKFDTIACSGRSGLSIAAPLAYLMNKELVIVNKKGISAHDSGKISHSPNVKVSKVVILDDFVASGYTIRNIAEVITSKMNKPDIIGVYLYKHFSQGADISCSGQLFKLLSRNPKFSENNSSLVIGYVKPTGR